MEPLKKRFFKSPGAICALLLGLIAFPGGYLPGNSVHLRVGIYQNEPKIFTDEKGEPSGIFPGLLNEISRREGWKLTYVPCKWDHCLKALLSGQIDLMPDVALSPDRIGKFDFNKIPVIPGWSQIYTLPENHIHGLGDLKGKRISLLLGSVQEASFKNLMRGFGFEYTAIPASSYSQAFSLVKQGIAHAAVSNNYYGEKQINPRGLVKTPIIFDPVSLHFVAKKGKTPAVLDTIDRYMDRWIHTPNSFYYRCLSGYLEKPIIQPSKGFPAWIPVAVVLIVLSLSALLFFGRVKKSRKDENRTTAGQTPGDDKKRFRSYFENAPFGIFMADEKGNYLEVNKAAAEITGYSVSELVGKNLRELTPVPARRGAFGHFTQVKEHGRSSGVFPFVNKKGEHRYWRVDAIKISENRFLGFTVDVNRQHRAEMELIKLKGKLELQVKKKTKELRERIKELEYFQEVTEERELRMKELQEEIERLKSRKS